MRSVGFKVLKGEKLCGEVGVVGTVGIKNDPNSSDLGKIYCSLYLFFFGWKVGAWERSSMMVSIHLGGWNKWFVTSKWFVLFIDIFRRKAQKIHIFSWLGGKCFLDPAVATRIPGREPPPTAAGTKVSSTVGKCLCVEKPGPIWRMGPWCMATSHDGPTSSQKLICLQ